MATTRKWVQQATPTTVMESELNGLAAGSLVRSTASFSNTQGTANWDGYTRAIVQMMLSSGTAPTAAFAANSTLDVWILKEVGSQVEDGVGGTTPARPPDFSFPLETITTVQYVSLDVRLPPGTIYFLARNNQGSGSVALAASATANSITVQPYTDQGV